MRLRISSPSLQFLSKRNSVQVGWARVKQLGCVSQWSSLTARTADGASRRSLSQTTNAAGYSALRRPSVGERARGARGSTIGSAAVRSEFHSSGAETAASEDRSGAWEEEEGEEREKEPRAVVECRNVPFGLTEPELASLFQEVVGDTVTNLQFVGKKSGVALVELASISAAEAAVAELDESYYNGSKLRVTVRKATLQVLKDGGAGEAAEEKLKKAMALRQTALTRVATSKSALSNVKKGLSERMLFREGSSRARGGSEWVRKYKKEEIRAGDWECYHCGFRVFSSKTKCFKCGETKEGATVQHRRKTRRARMVRKEMSEVAELREDVERQSVAGLLSG
eukprot:CAMPEP_0198200436 /NCGR_PEP_ID=MMETSP1445-20131203/3449_1 /TAXON_ID=36898 /ORGANISM="Pyramimonas sp., Strain CCMP2087" /LENGTH=339 /DNA_ID=CAMNT_0043870505 /DNA_START=221 /DNA_END=1237 /DNA_ORIENTATION=+